MEEHTKTETRNPQPEAAAGPRVLLAMPIRETCEGDIRGIQWATEQARRPGVRFIWVASDSCANGRNVAIETGLGMADWPWTHLLTHDDDILPQWDMLDRLLAHDKPIVAGCYPLRIGTVDMWNFKLPGSGQWWHGGDPRVELAREPGFPLLEVEAVGGGAVLSRRAVFEAIAWPWHQAIYGPMDEHGATLKMDEAVYFCRKAKKARFPLYVDVTCTCDHFKKRALP